ncbi:MAG: HEAT repeat domain-containing protein [Verrucomicrobia bacterium]|nr:HEAT repeat domain-containing protein [Verrucomicrobiota bacterium]
MNQRQCITRLGLLAVPAVAAALWLWIPREPVYQGKNLSAWIEDFAGQDEEARALAAEAIRQMDEQAVPHLLRTFRAIDRPFKRRVLEWRWKVAQWFWERTGRSRTHPSPPSVWNRMEAEFKALLLVGHAAAPHLPEFVALLRNEVFIGATLIHAVGPAAGLHPTAEEAASILVAHLGEHDADTSHAVRGALRAVGASAVLSLATALGNGNELGRRWAADLLGSIGEKPEIAVPALIRSLKDNDQNVRRNAIAALEQFEAREAIPALRKTLDAGDADVRRAAIGALARFEDREAIPALRRLLADERAGVRASAALALGKLGVDVKECVTALREAVERGEMEGTIEALIELEPDDTEAISWQVQRLDDPQAYVVRDAAEALSRIGPVAEIAVPALLRALNSKDEWRRSIAADVLARIGPAAMNAIPNLILALRDTDKGVRVSAARALAKTGPEAAEVASALVAGLNDKEKEVRVSSAEALGHLTLPNPETALSLGRAVEDGSHRVRLAAIQSLEKFGAKAKGAARFLHRALQDPFPSVREAAFQALRRVDHDWPAGDL